jgi:hypothetical protein
VSALGSIATANRPGILAGGAESRRLSNARTVNRPQKCLVPTNPRARRDLARGLCHDEAAPSTAWESLNHSVGA